MNRFDKVASRYARAIFDFAGGGKKARALLAELKGFADAAGSHEGLGRALASRLVSDESRRSLVEDLAKKLGVGEDARRILLVLSDSRRLDRLDGILGALHHEILGSEGVVPMTVEAAGTLSQDDRTKVEKKFSTLFGKQVEATYVESPTLVGGIRVTAAGKTYNGTLSGWLEAFKERLVGG